MKQSILPIILQVALLPLLSPSVSAQVKFSTDFESPDDYDDHFVKLSASGTADVLWEEWHLNKSGDGVRSIIFDTTANGGSEGQRGSVGEKANNDYGSLTISSVFRIGAFNTASMGFWSHVDDNYTSGCLGLISFTSSTSLRLRIFENGNPSGGGAGSLLSDQIFTVSLSTSTDYTGVFDVVNSSSGVSFTLSLYDASGLEEIASLAGIDTNSPVFTGQAGLRLASRPLNVKSFSVVPKPIPEPSTVILLAGAAIGISLYRRRSVRR